jgi:3-oxoacyl-(acyl-carrier-protein) synthase
MSAPSQSAIRNPQSAIAGMGWVTPLGAGLDEVWARLENGDRAEVQEISSPHSPKKHRALTVPPKTVDALGRNPRLRRSSVISYYSVAAALAALENAGIQMTPEIAERTAVVFAVSSGGVVYTRKFYETVVQQGANAASPLLFPETVYNAPASHLAALLGITGMTYTLVGDGSIGLAALKFAEQLLDTVPGIDRVVVAGGEEADWFLCEAYREWNLRAMLAEGGAALVIGREGRIALDEIHDGVSFSKKSAARPAIRKVVGELAAKNGAVDLAVGSANGTFIDAAESAAIAEFFPNTPVEFPKRALGDALGAGALIQTIHGALALQKRGLKRALVTSLGFNQQAGGLVLTTV